MPHGGKRTGAGRKPDPDKKQPISLKLSPKVVEYLKSVNASVMVDETIQRSKAFREWLKQQPSNQPIHQQNRHTDSRSNEDGTP